jgi:hypothetical protein
MVLRPTNPETILRVPDVLVPPDAVNSYTQGLDFDVLSVSPNRVDSSLEHAVIEITLDSTTLVGALDVYAGAMNDIATRRLAFLIVKDDDGWLMSSVELFRDGRWIPIYAEKS